MKSLSVSLALLLAAALSPAAAHSLADLESQLHDRDLYAQFVDQPAANFQLLDLDGTAVDLSSLHGQVVVLNFVYARCKEVCPAHMLLIARLQDMMASAGMAERVQFVTIATDTEDAAATRAVMTEYAQRYGLEDRNWSFLYRTAEEPVDTTMRVAEAYGLQFTPAGEGVQMHGLVTHVIDQTGRLRARFHGLKFEPVNLVSYVNALVNDDHSR